jgi:hypothetical protein
LYPDLERSEQMFMVVDTLEERAIKTDDHTKRASLKELGKGFEPIFQAGPIGWLIAQAQKLLSQVRKDRRHPHIRPYCRPYVETLVHGLEVIREYVEILAGREAIRKANERLQRLSIGAKEAIKANNELLKVRLVKKETSEYRRELEAKQQDANNRRRRRRP